MQPISLSRTIQVLLFLFLVFAGLYYAKGFLIPVALAGIFAMLFLPISRRLERAGINRGWSALLCILILLLFVSGVAILLTWHMSDLAKDFSEIKESALRMIEQFREWLNNKFGISLSGQSDILKEPPSDLTAAGAGILYTFFDFVVHFILVVVYIFLFLYFRSHLKKFGLMLTPADKKSNVSAVIAQCSHVAQQYLAGLSMMIASLWIMYSIGFAVVGVENFLFFAILCGLLELVPFVGNLTGNLITVLFSLAQGAGSGIVVGIIITYALVQFIQTYFLEPLVVGAEVNINPLFTILVLVLGELLWGIAGLVLAIPLLGIVKIICDNIEALKPYGFLIGGNNNKEKKKRRLVYQRRSKTG